MKARRHEGTQARSEAEARVNRWGRASLGAWALLAMWVLGTPLVGGCAQNTATPQNQPSAQGTVTDQETRSAGAQTNIYVINAPARGVAGEYSSSQAGALLRSAKLTTGEATNAGAGSEASDATFLQHGVVINVNQGSTTPTVTGSSSGSQQPGMAATISPNQEPRATVNTPIAFGMPGSAPQATGAASLEGPATTTAHQQNELRTLLQKYHAGQASPADITRLNELGQALFGSAIVPPASQPSRPGS